MSKFDPADTERGRHELEAEAEEAENQEDEDEEVDELQEQLDDLSYDDLTALFAKGVDDYTGGVEPEGWKHPDARKNPYLAGWLIAAESENGIEWFNAENTDMPRTGLDI